MARGIVTKEDIRRLRSYNPRKYDAKCQIFRDLAPTLPQRQVDAFLMAMPFLVGRTGWSYTKDEIAERLGITEDEVHELVTKTLTLLSREWQRRYYGPQLTWLDTDDEGCGRS